MKQTLEKQITEFGESAGAQERVHALSDFYHAHPLRGVVQEQERTERAPESYKQQKIRDSQREQMETLLEKELQLRQRELLDQMARQAESVDGA